MKINRSSRFLRVGVLLLTASLLTGCVYWRLYRVKMQLGEFDRYLSIEVTDRFTVNFKDPVMYREDFNVLSRLLPSSCIALRAEKFCIYRFYKVDGNQKRVIPEVQFFFKLNFNVEDRLIAWTSSPIFLKIAPPAFLEISLRSLGGGEINKKKHQLKADFSSVEKISAQLPLKADTLVHLGTPLKIESKPGAEVYLYHFLLETPSIESGYEDRALSVIKLTFDEATSQLVKMAGSFAGLKISIDYRKYRKDPKKADALAL